MDEIIEHHHLDVRLHAAHAHLFAQQDKLRRLCVVCFGAGRQQASWVRAVGWHPLATHALPSLHLDLRYAALEVLGDRVARL